MVPLHLEKLKSNTLFAVPNALKNFFGFIVEKIRPELAEVRKLIEKLEALPNVQAARGIRNKNGDSRKIIFEILVPQGGSQKSKVKSQNEDSIGFWRI
ncbi:hypothetical protein [Anabaena sp. AL93]|uniref:hypothetical protein n=1 Tax=Anabaena sp. AL93 TaxID=1678133 RepID=UPI0007FDF164|nr:hypothetical protein [Anabaena sp. AL93]OBQ23061.1 MAG: hypothetical protein AN486_01015 [Anabaena sp. AL93]